VSREPPPDDSRASSHEGARSLLIADLLILIWRSFQSTAFTALGRSRCRGGG